MGAESRPLAAVASNSLVVGLSNISSKPQYRSSGASAASSNNGGAVVGSESISAAINSSRLGKTASTEGERTRTRVGVAGRQQQQWQRRKQQQAEQRVAAAAQGSSSCGRRQARANGCWQGNPGRAQGGRDSSPATAAYVWGASIAMDSQGIRGKSTGCSPGRTQASLRVVGDGPEQRINGEVRRL